jgi:hypothetical protein
LFDRGHARPPLFPECFAVGPNGFREGQPNPLMR